METRFDGSRAFSKKLSPADYIVHTPLLTHEILHRARRFHPVPGTPCSRILPPALSPSRLPHSRPPLPRPTVLQLSLPAAPRPVPFHTGRSAVPRGLSRSSVGLAPPPSSRRLVHPPRYPRFRDAAQPRPPREARCVSPQSSLLGRRIASCSFALSLSCTFAEAACSACSPAPASGRPPPRPPRLHGRPRPGSRS
jgi:hypothetical protein